MNVNLTEGLNLRVEGEIGIYTISDYTLSLRYNSGRTKTLSFTGALRNNAAVNNDLIYIKGNPFFKRHK